MKRFLASALICAAPLSILIAPPAAAQWTVYDPANHIQNIYQAIRSLQRDGGARLDVSSRLYDQVRTWHEPDVSNTWGRFWR